MSGITNISGKNTEDKNVHVQKSTAEIQKTEQKSRIIPIVEEKNDTNTGFDTLTLKADDKAENNKEEKKKEESENFRNDLFKNTAFSKTKNSSGLLNNAYKDYMSANGIVQNVKMRVSESSQLVMNEFLSTFEKSQGNDENDAIVDFLSEDIPKGYHLNGVLKTYYENGSDKAYESLNANIFNTYRKDNLSVSAGGSYEYSKQTKPDSQMSKSGNALLMAKLKQSKYTYALGGTANIYDDDSKLYNIYVGAMHNASNIAATLRRKITVTVDEYGEKQIVNNTDVKINLIKPKEKDELLNDSKTRNQNKSKKLTSEEPSDLPPDETKDNVKKFDFNKFSLDVEFSTAEGDDSYGAVIKYTDLINFNKNQKYNENNLLLTPYVGVYDEHPDTEEGLKLKGGITGKYTVSLGNNFKASVDSNAVMSRIIRPSSQPIDTYAATLSGSLAKGKIAATIGAGYVQSEDSTKFTYLNGELDYTLKSSTISIEAGYEKHTALEQDSRTLHLATKYTINF